MEQTITQNGALYLAQHRARKRYVAVAAALWKQARHRLRDGVADFLRASAHLRELWRDLAAKPQQGSTRESRE
jgi:hypothetical protein